MEALSSVKITGGKLSSNHTHVLVLDFLDHGDTVCWLLLWYTWLTAAILCKRPLYFAKVLSFCMKMPVIIHPTGLTAVCGCKSVRTWIIPYLALSVLSLTESLRSTWLASDCSRCWCETSYHLFARELDNSVFTLKYKPWYHCGADAEMVVVTMLRSDVYHLLHMCHVLIKVTITFWHESVCNLIFWKFFLCTLQSEQVSS